MSIAATIPLDSLRFQSSIEIWFLEDDPDLIVHREFLQRFHSNEVALLAVFSEDVFAPDVLARIHRLTRAAAGAPPVPLPGRRPGRRGFERIRNRSRLSYLGTCLSYQDRASVRYYRSSNTPIFYDRGGRVAPLPECLSRLVDK